MEELKLHFTQNEMENYLRARGYIIILKKQTRYGHGPFRHEEDVFWQSMAIKDNKPPEPVKKVFSEEIKNQLLTR